MIKKLITTLASNRWKVIGRSAQLKYTLAFILNSFNILRNRNLYEVDAFMANGTVYTIRHQYGQFKINPKAIDEIVKEDSKCFSGMREMYLKDCYFKFHKLNPEEIQTVLDMGANRGLFSLMCTPFAKRIIAIEANEKYNEAIRYSIEKLNQFAHLEIGNFFIGEKDNHAGHFENRVTMEFMLRKYDIQSIDFLKMDIEGSEFEIWSTIPFASVRYLSMEVHPQFGSVEKLVTHLKSQGFKVMMATSEMKETSDYYLFTIAPMQRRSIPAPRRRGRR